MPMSSPRAGGAFLTSDAFRAPSFSSGKMCIAANRSSTAELWRGVLAPAHSSKAVTAVVPKFAVLYQDLGVELPAPTRLLISLTVDYRFVVLGTIAAIFAAAIGNFNPIAVALLLLSAWLWMWLTVRLGGSLPIKP